MKALIALFFAVAGSAVTYVHLKHGIHDLAWPTELTWTTAGTLLFSVLAIVVGLSHLQHAIKTLMQRNVYTVALVVVFAASLVSLIVGGAWLFGMLFFEAFRSEKHAVLMLSMVWGGGALTLGSLFTLAAISDYHAPAERVGANDNRDPKAPPPPVPVVTADVYLSKEASELYGRPVPGPMKKFVY
jgi:hypothetical protein